MKKLSSYKTTEGAQWHREGAENGIRELKNHLTYPESRDDAKIEKPGEGAAWIIKPIVVRFIQFRISKLLKPVDGIQFRISKPLKPVDGIQFRISKLLKPVAGNQIRVAKPPA